MDTPAKSMLESPFTYLTLSVLFALIVFGALALHRQFHWAGNPRTQLMLLSCFGVFMALVAGCVGWRYHTRWHTGLLAGITMLINLQFLLGYIASSSSGPRPPSCARNLKHLGLSFKMYANEHQGNYPVLSPEAGRLMFTTIPIYPNYLSDTLILICPADENALEQGKKSAAAYASSLIDDQSYFYLGYLVTNDEEMRAFAAAYKERIAAGQSFEDDLNVPAGTGSGGSDRIFRLRDGVEQHLMKDVDSPQIAMKLKAQIPVMWERTTLASGETETVSSHPKNMINVLYLDGHVKAIHPGTWPHTEETMRLLHELDTLR